MNPATLDPETTWYTYAPDVYTGEGDGYAVVIDHERWDLDVSGRNYTNTEPTVSDAITAARDIRRLVMGC